MMAAWSCWQPFCHLRQESIWKQNEMEESGEERWRERGEGRRGHGGGEGGRRVGAGREREGGRQTQGPEIVAEPLDHSGTWPSHRPSFLNPDRAGLYFLLTKQHLWVPSVSVHLVTTLRMEEDGGRAFVCHGEGVGCTGPCTHTTSAGVHRALDREPMGPGPGSTALPPGPVTLSPFPGPQSGVSDERSSRCRGGGWPSRPPIPPGHGGVSSQTGRPSSQDFI